VFQELQKTHEKQGIHAKLVLMKKAMDMQFKIDVPLSKMIDEYCAIHKQIIQMGPIDEDQLLATYLINGLNDNPIFKNIQSNLISSANDSNFSSKEVIHHLLQQDSLIHLRADQQLQASTAFATQGQGRPRMLCNHCKKMGHLANFCIQPGGKMAR
jgi:hypothetical protein